MPSANEIYPVIPLRDVVLFPAVTMPLYVGRPRTLRALSEAKEGVVFVVAQRDGAVDAPMPTDLHSIGTMAQVVEQSPHEGGGLRLLVTGKARARARRFLDDGPCLLAELEKFSDPAGDGNAIARDIQRIAGAVTKDLPATDPARMGRMQDILEVEGLSDAERLQRLLALME